MASIARHGKTLVCVCANNIAVYDVCSQSKQVYSCTKEELGDRSNPDGSDRILCSGFSPSGKFFAVCDDWKQLTLWDVEKDKWTRKSIRPLVRRGTSLTFTKTETDVLIADKSGDVYSFSTSNAEEEGTLLMGHVSMLLDIALCGPEQLIATADRDEKIRISNYPNAYNIHTYCLGHTKFVSKLQYLERQDCLLSGGGDGTIRLWNYNNGTQLTMADCRQQMRLLKSSSSTEEVKDTDSTNGKAENDEGKSKDGSEGKMETEEDKEKRDEDEKAGEEEKSQDEDKVDDEDEYCCINCLGCDEEKNIVAVGLDGVSAIFIYKLTTAKDEDRSLELLQTIETVAPPWGFIVDPEEGRIVILQQKEGHMLEILAWNSEKQVYEKPSKNDESLAKLSDVINKDWDLFKDCKTDDNIYRTLHKPKTDSAKDEYFKRKQQRIEQQKSDLQSGKRKSKQRRDREKRQKSEN